MFTKQLSKSENAEKQLQLKSIELNKKFETIDNQLADCKNQSNRSDKQLLTDCERNLIRKDISIEMINETNEKLTNQKIKLTNEKMAIIEERGGLKTQIEQLTKEIGQCTQKLNACVNDN